MLPNPGKISDNQKWVLRQRADRRARANALRLAGERELEVLLQQYKLKPSEAELIRACPLDDLVRRAQRATLRHPLIEAIKNLPYGWRNTTLTAIGAKSQHKEIVIEFQDSPVLSCRVGRRAAACRRIAAIGTNAINNEKNDLRYGVVTSPNLIPLFGDIEQALDIHLALIKNVASIARGAGWKPLARSIVTVHTPGSDR